MPFGPTHSALRSIAKAAVDAFYDDIQVVSGDHVPVDGPVIAACNHWNMTVDPAALSCYFPHGRKLHYWAKDGLFKNKWASKILIDAGNLPVSRSGSGNEGLYAKTFEVLKLGECVAVFPEGTSLDVPGLMPLKNGLGWTALDYAKSLRDDQGQLLPEYSSAQDVVIAVAGLTYTNKDKYRSRVIVEFAESIQVAPFLEEFYRAPKAAVAKLTAELDRRMRSVTINAQTWEGARAAKMARELVWAEDNDLSCFDYRLVTQELIDLFECDLSSTSEEVQNVKKLLLDLYADLKTAKLTNASLTARTLPKDLDPSTPVKLPARLTTIWYLLRDSLSSLVRLPFFALPLLFHMPLYIIAKQVGSRLTQDEVESAAQNKIVLGLLVLIVAYPALFGFLWLLLFLNPIGGALAFIITWAFAIYHSTLITSNYRRAKRLTTTWRVLLAVWTGNSGNTVKAALRTRQQASLALYQLFTSLGPDRLPYLTAARQSTRGDANTD